MRFLAVFPRALLIATAIPFLLSLGARLGFLMETLRHFAVHYTLAALLSMVLAAGMRQRRVAGAALLLALATSFIWAPGVLWERPVLKPGIFEDVRIFQYNAYFRNADPDAIVRHVTALPKEERPDILLFQEVTPPIAQALRGLAPLYPYAYEKPVPASGAGMTLYSRLPFAEPERRHTGAIRTAYTVFVFETPEQHFPFALFELHTSPPFDNTFTARRNRELAFIAGAVAHHPAMRKVLLGDLNVTPFSPHFEDLATRSELISSLAGRYPWGTWPAHLPALLRIPIDHVLTTSNIVVITREVGPDLGSDHLPAITTLRLYP